MTEPAPRPTATRSRGGGRGGRGGSRGSTRPRDRHTNGDHKDQAAVNDLADEGDFGEMKKKYAPQIAQLKEMFPDESNEDLAFALDESSGDTFPIIEQITEGRFSRFSDVKTTKERTKPKPKDQPSGGAPAEPGSKSTRSRGAHDTVRSSARSRPERGRGSTRGGRGAHGANGVRSSGDPKSVPTDDSSWNVSASKAESGDWDTNATTEGAGSSKGPTSKVKAAPTTAGVKTTAQSDGPPKQSWAQLLRKAEPAPVVQKQPKPMEPAPPIEEPPTVAAAEEDTTPIPQVADELSANDSLEDLSGTEDPSITITPSKDQLTEENVEHLPDSSHPAPTDTAASTVDSHSATPSVVGQTQPIPIGRPPMGGFATSAHRATATPRSASFQRRFLEQQEAVIMPGNHALDRATVQFGSMGLNGDADLDVDEDREDAETRQPPQQSPPSQPRASLPPAPRQHALPAEPQLPDPIQATKPAPGLSSVQQPAEPTAAQQGPQAGQPYNQFGRIGQNLPSDTTAAQKSYDLFGQHQSQQSAFDNYPSHSQASGQSQQQSQIGGFSSGPNDYSFYSSDHPRNTFQNYYGAGYGQQGGANQQEAGTSQQRTGSGFGGSGADIGYSNQAQAASQNRYGTSTSENAQTSGQATPNPPLATGASTVTSGAPSSQLQQSASQAQQQPQSQQQQQQPFNQQTPQGHAGAQHPYGSYQNYYSNPYYASYMNQYPYSQGAGAYGGGPFGRNNYGGGGPAHHGYGMPSHSSYDQQSSSPANVGSFGGSSVHERPAPGLGGNLSDYGRSGSAQGGSQTGAGFGSMAGSDSFGRSPSGFPSQNTPYSQQSSTQQQQSGTTSESDPLKPFGDSKAAGGPSPGLPGRPGSAANQNSGLPPPQNQHGGFGPYGSQQFGQGTYGNLGGLGGQHNQSGYGYGGGFGNYGSYGRGSWGGNYGAH